MSPFQERVAAMLLPILTMTLIGVALPTLLPGNLITEYLVAASR
jgi:hypothetical protein